MHHPILNDSITCDEYVGARTTDRLVCQNLAKSLYLLIIASNIVTKEVKTKGMIAKMSFQYQGVRDEVECAMCGVSSIVQQKEVNNYVHMSNTDDYISCNTCNKYKFCATCIGGLYQQVVVDGGTKYDANDSSYQTLISMYNIINNTEIQHNNISCGPCCSFRTTISKTETTTKRSTSKPPFPPSVDSYNCDVDNCNNDSSDDDSSSASDDDDDDIGSSDSDSDCSDDDDYKAEQTSSRDDRISDLRYRVARLRGSPSLCNKLEDYHNDPTVYTCRGKLKRVRPSDMVDEINNKRSKHRPHPRSPIQHNHFEGLLLIHMWGIGIQSDTCSQLTADHMALAKSLVDNTPSASHCVTSKMSADKAFALNNNRKTLKDCMSEKINLRVPSPEDESRYRDLVVNVIWIDQTLTYEQSKKQFVKGKNDFTPDYLHNIRLFSNDDVDEDVDYTVLLGTFSKENNSLPAKLLLIRPSNMMTNIIYTREDRDELAKSIYTSLRAYVGKRGYEMRRVCGSSGLVSSTSDKDLLAVLREHKGLLPRKVGGVAIFRRSDRYQIFYRRVNADPSQSLFGYVYYSPPQDGGAFDMPPILMSTSFPLVDQAYNKMLAIVMMNELNRLFRQRNILPVAIGPLGCEMTKINKAREVYLSSAHGTKMYNMICAINKMNNFSFVGYDARNHEDHYYSITNEYVENKSTWAINKHITKTIGRGGSILPNKYVFAVLDWGKIAKERAAAKKRAASKGLRSASTKKKRKKN